MPTPQYDVVKLGSDAPEAKGLPAFVSWMNIRLGKLSDELTGPKSFPAGDSGAAITINAPLNHITALTLTDDCAVTLRIDRARKGASGSIEFTQDATGGWVPTFVNLLGDVPTIATDPAARTLVLFTNVGQAFVATVLASDY